MPVAAAPDSAPAWLNTPSKLVVPRVANMSMIARLSPTSPTRLAMNAFLAAVAALGMLSGFCGTLCTPMAANFNLVPAALLGLRGDWAVIRAQAPTAAVLLGVNGALLYWVVARTGR